MQALHALGADIVVLIHLAFIGFVVSGGFLRGRRVWIRLLHPPAMLWAIGLSLFGWTCPLTLLENALLARAGSTTHEGGFIAFPLLAGLVIGVNLIAYAGDTFRSRRRSTEADKDGSGKP
ncbi:MAG: DUF2784 domain-containing protein [Casimicrobiaceae bacterium]